MKLSKEHGVTITHNETCFMERVPREVLTITDPSYYDNPLHTLYLTFDELVLLNQAISEYIKSRKGE